MAKRYYLNKLTAKQLKELVAWDEKESETGRGWLALYATEGSINDKLEDDCIPFTIGIRNGKPRLVAQYSGPYPRTAKAKKFCTAAMKQQQANCDDLMRTTLKSKLYFEKIV